MNSLPAIQIQNLGKEYILGGAEVSHGSLRELLADSFTTPFRKLKNLRGKDNSQDRFWALKDINIDIMPGDVVGVIGSNGAGKSTLLKILARITEPTIGKVVTRGRIASLLEVGTGFHPELTGRENILLNGSILGMKRSEIKQKFDNIVDFANVEKFIDTPVKRYSTGMSVRLAFSVAAFLESEILVVDEVLAVGDLKFQKKCLGKINSIANDGRTVLFVSHNMAAVRSLCERGVLLHKGCLVSDSKADEAINLYMRQNENQSIGATWHWAPETAPGGEDAYLRRVSIRAADGNDRNLVSPDEPFEIVIEYAQKNSLSGARFVLQLVRATGEIAFASTDQIYRTDEITLPGVYRTVCSIPGEILNVGRYLIQLCMDASSQAFFIEPLDVGYFEVAGLGNHGTLKGAETWPGAVCPKLNWKVAMVE